MTIRFVLKKSVYVYIFNIVITIILLLRNHDLIAEESLIFDIKKVPGKFSFLEGPTWSESSDRFYFSDMHFSMDTGEGPLSNILTLAEGETPQLVFKDSGTNGLISYEEKLYAANHKLRGLCVITDKCYSLLTHYNRRKFNSPNDLVISRLGVVYFSDPDWQLWGRKRELLHTSVYAFNLEKSQLQIIDDSLPNPNGVALSPGENKLYVGAGNDSVYVYNVDSFGSVDTSTRQLFAKVNAPDGLAVDEKGNIYVASHITGEIVVFSNLGNEKSKIKIDTRITNIAFGGKDWKSLLITTPDYLYLAKTKYKGSQSLNKK